MWQRVHVLTYEIIVQIFELPGREEAAIIQASKNCTEVTKQN